MAAAVMPVPLLQFADQDGNPLVGGKLYAYEAGTDTPLDMYTDTLLMVAYTNPIILDAAGTPGGPVYLLPQSYKFALTDADDVAIGGWPVDNIPAVAVAP